MTCIARFLIVMVFSLHVSVLAADAQSAPKESVVDPAVDKAIDKGLAYLAKTQAKDGSFGNASDAYGRNPGVVALAGMAFLAKGHLPGYGQYGEVINRCIDYVIKDQDTKTGVIGKRDPQHAMYSHTICTLFLSEVSGMVDPARQSKLDVALSKAVKVILSAQKVHKDQNNKGGWRYQANSTDSDLSCSGWALMALKSARLNGAAIPKQAIDDAVGYIMRKGNKQTGQFGYQEPATFPVTLTGAALLCLELTGHHGEDCTYKAGDYILRTFKQLPGEPRHFYGNYYNAQAMFQLGGKYWEKYSQWMYGNWLSKQQANGAWLGETCETPFGNTYSTSMMLLAFTVPYRQLPIYQRDETVDEKGE